MEVARGGRFWNCERRKAAGPTAFKLLSNHIVKIGGGTQTLIYAEQKWQSPIHAERGPQINSNVIKKRDLRFVAACPVLL